MRPPEHGHDCESPTDTPLKGVMICGAGHSGSTLLGLILDGHSACFYLGEGGKIRYLHDESKPLRKRACKLCGENCPVWSQFRWDRARPLYRQVAAHVGSSVIIDSTKNADWIRERIGELRGDGAQAYLLYLVRDGRAVINSRLRKYPERDAEQQIVDWMHQIERSEALFTSFDGPKLRVRYEDLATDPERVVTALCGVLDLPFESNMLRFDEFVHHPLGGNNGTQFLASRQRLDDPDSAAITLGDRSRAYYEGHARGVQLDLRWKRELQPEHLALFGRVAGQFNQSMQWEG